MLSLLGRAVDDEEVEAPSIRASASRLNLLGAAAVPAVPAVRPGGRNTSYCMNVAILGGLLPAELLRDVVGLRLDAPGRG